MYQKPVAKSILGILWYHLRAYVRLLIWRYCGTSFVLEILWYQLRAHMRVLMWGYCGTRSRGDGWWGPYLKGNELWVDLHVQ
eukprot:3017093-Rhodomonas_salina.1